jgi:hypothetical protein
VHFSPASACAGTDTDTGTTRIAHTACPTGAGRHHLRLAGSRGARRVNAAPRRSTRPATATAFTASRRGRRTGTDARVGFVAGHVRARVRCARRQPGARLASALSPPSATILGLFRSTLIDGKAPIRPSRPVLVFAPSTRHARVKKDCTQNCTRTHSLPCPWCRALPRLQREGDLSPRSATLNLPRSRVRVPPLLSTSQSLTSGWLDFVRRAGRSDRRSASYASREEVSRIARESAGSGGSA